MLGWISPFAMKQYNPYRVFGRGMYITGKNRKEYQNL
jgi:hypothetical protein